MPKQDHIAYYEERVELHRAAARTCDDAAARDEHRRMSEKYQDVVEALRSVQRYKLSQQR